MSGRKRSIEVAGLILLALPALAAPPRLDPEPPPEPPPPETCQYVQVVDPCQGDVLIFRTGEQYIDHNVPVPLMLEEFDATGVDFSTVPGWSQKFSFVTQGPYLRVIDQTSANVYRTVDVEFNLGIAGIRLNKVEAAEPVLVGGRLQYPLYLIGYRWAAAGGVEPYFVVLDQERLLQMSLSPPDLILGHGAVCVDGVECSGTGLDIAASAPLGGSKLQEAYASVLNIESGVGHRQRFYRIDLGLNGNFSVSLDPWNEDPDPYGGLAHRSIGLDYDSTGLRPFGLFQTTAQVADLLSGERSCELDGDPTDIEVWGPGAGLEHTTYHFVTSRDSAGDKLIGFPEGECPTAEAENSIVLPVGSYPRAIGLSSSTENEFWVYTANKNHGVTAVRLRIVATQPAGDRIEVIEQLDIPFAGCPIDVSFRDEAITTCDEFEFQPDKAEPQSPEPECLDPWDPACIDPDEDCDPEGGCTLPIRGR